jgi:hypothetical protein
MKYYLHCLKAVKKQDWLKLVSVTTHGGLLLTELNQMGRYMDFLME